MVGCALCIRSTLNVPRARASHMVAEHTVHARLPPSPMDFEIRCDLRAVARRNQQFPVVRLEPARSVRISTISSNCFGVSGGASGSLAGSSGDRLVSSVVSVATAGRYFPLFANLSSNVESRNGLREPANVGA